MVKPILIVVLVAAALFGLDAIGDWTSNFASEKATFHLSDGRDIGVLNVTVTEGATRTATVSCGRSNSGTGYLSGGAAGAACVTAVISWPGHRFLEEGKLLSGKWCKQHVGTQPAAGAYAEIVGTWNDRPIRRRLGTASKCERATWEFLSPLFTPAREPLTFGQDAF